MTAHLLLVALGPVQEFIAQARRTRDLWYGSHLLSELGRAAARTLIDQGAELILPAIRAEDPELEPCVAPLRSKDRQPLNIANKLLAEVPDTIDPKEISREVREAVMRFWREDIAGSVRVRCSTMLAEGIDEIWNEQIDTFVEFAACWVPLGDYPTARRELERAIAGRKLLRDFSQWRHARGAVAKSSLDGARETVLRPPRWRGPLASRFRIADSEELDAIGLVKRAGGDPGQFVPIVNVALASLLDLASRVALADLELLASACREVGIARVDRIDLLCTDSFRYDASVLLADRWPSIFAEQGLAGDPIAWGRRYVQPLFEKVAEPYPYVACVVADGDRIGRAIDRLSSPAEHRVFSRALGNFAGQARTAVEQDHRGVLVYAGGDDLLAFLPVPEALACAEELREQFAGVVESACRFLPPEHRPTLSVGVGIGHVMESMGHLLELGRAAEAEAKDQRNALCVLAEKRSGGRRSWRAQWSDEPVSALRESAALFADRLSSSKVYEIASIVKRLPAPADVGGVEWYLLLSLEVRRALARAEGGALTPDQVGLALDEGKDYAALQAHVTSWVDRMLIARTIDRAIPRQRRRGSEAVA